MTIARWIERSDHRLMLKVNQWRPPRWVRFWMIASTRGGDGWLWWSVGLCFALFGGRYRIPALAAAAVAVTAGIVAFLQLKRICGRRRPGTYFKNCWSTLLPPDRFSFPSGHTITAFAIAVSLSMFYPAGELRAWLSFCAASVGVSRIMVGMHFLSDVLAGAAIGSLLGYLSGLAFRLWATGELRDVLRMAMS